MVLIITHTHGKPIRKKLGPQRRIVIFLQLRIFFFPCFPNYYGNFSRGSSLFSDWVHHCKDFCSPTIHLGNVDVVHCSVPFFSDQSLKIRAFKIFKAILFDCSGQFCFCFSLQLLPKDLTENETESLSAHIWLPDKHDAFSIFAYASPSERWCPKIQFTLANPCPPYLILQFASKIKSLEREWSARNNDALYSNYVNGKCHPIAHNLQMGIDKNITNLALVNEFTLAIK